MKFVWSYRYVKEGQIEFDRQGRWALDCYIFISIKKALPQYTWATKSFKQKHVRTRVATICQKGSSIGSVPSVVHKFAVQLPSFDDAGNTGFSRNHYSFSNDIEELKKITEERFKHIQKCFANCL